MMAPDTQTFYIEIRKFVPNNGYSTPADWFEYNFDGKITVWDPQPIAEQVRVVVEGGRFENSDWPDWIKPSESEEALET